jgi:hypothetical protein
LVKLAEDILVQAQRPVGETCVVVVDAYEPAVAVLSPIVRGAGGHFFDLANVAREGVTSPLGDSALQDRIKAPLSTGPGGDLEFRLDGSGRLRAFYVSDGSSPTEDLVLASATVATSPALAQGGLVVVAYNETGQEAAIVNRTWTFLRHTLPDLAVDNTTLVVVCATDHVDYGRMCGEEPAGRLFVQGDAYLKRNAGEQDRVTIGHLAGGHSPEHLVLFLAAGFSASSGLALGNTLRDIALREYLNDQLSAATTLPSKFYEALPTGRRMATEQGRPNEQLAADLTLERVLRELTSRGTNPSRAILELESKHAAAVAHPGAAVRHLHRMLSNTRRKLVLVTVNFDQLVERDHMDLVEPFITDDDFERAADYVREYLDDKQDKAPLLKIHGSLEQPESLVFNLDATAAGLPPRRVEAMQEALTARHGKKVPVVYVGASMRDQDLTPLLGSPSNIDSTDEYWVSPLPVSTVEAFWERTSRIARWDQGNLLSDVESRFVTMTADAALDRLANALAL